MKNILHERPDATLTGRLRYCTRFVRDEHLHEKCVLDIGCGYGWFELHALGRGVRRIVGTEITGDDLETARTYFQDQRAEFAVAGALQLPFPDASFDTAVSWEVIEHIPKRTEDKMFAEVRRVLKPGGTLYLSTPHRSFWSNTLDPAWWLIGHRHYDADDLRALARRNGFSVEEIYVRGGWWTIIAILNMYITKWVFRRGPFVGAYFDRRVNAEYDAPVGFAGIFIRFTKL